MPNKYAEMDQWTDEELALFKEGDELIEKPSFNANKSATTSVKQASNSLTVVSEGDSWFNYKISVDIIDCLRLFHGYKIKNFASPGDTLENMIYGTQTNRNFERVTSQITIILERVKRATGCFFVFWGR